MHPRPRPSRGPAPARARAPAPRGARPVSAIRRVEMLAWLSSVCAVSVSDPVDVDQDVSRAAEDLVVAVRRRVDNEPWVFHAANKLTHRDLGLQPRKRTAKTEVDAAAIPEVLVVLAFEVDVV